MILSTHTRSPTYEPPYRINLLFVPGQTLTHYRHRYYYCCCSDLV